MIKKTLSFNLKFVQSTLLVYDRNYGMTQLIKNINYTWKTTNNGFCVQMPAATIKNLNWGENK